MFFDNLPLEITCPKCGKQIKETVIWLKAESRKCPFCGMLFDTTEFRRGIDEATNRFAPGCFLERKLTVRRLGISCRICDRALVSRRIFAGIAQLVEQLICNQQVVGSNPTAGSSINILCFMRLRCSIL
jgi:hypothetical protein